MLSNFALTGCLIATIGFLFFMIISDSRRSAFLKARNEQAVLNGHTPRRIVMK